MLFCGKSTLLKYFKFISFLLFIALFAIGCAKRGTITGGLKDTIGPVLKISLPENFSTDFKGDEINLTFDEYIKVKNINKQLIISPPMTTPPEITPQSASKYIKIKIKDTLLPNTTYSFNFGQSIEDNNEGNPYRQFKYVFSTGTYIDSLTLSGVVKDAYNRNVESFVSVMLYEINENFNDSTIYKQTPRYITNTLDSAKSFTLENLKEGKYLLLALKDYNSNNRFDPKKDKIGFHKQYVNVPNDTLFELELFNEELAFKSFKPTQASGNKFLMGYEGDASELKVSVRNGAEEIQTIITKFPEKDSVNIWYKSVKADSLQLAVTKGNYTDDFTLKIKEMKRDSLSFIAKQSGVLPLREDFTVKSSRPLVNFDNSLMTLVNKDSVAIPFETAYDEYEMQLKFIFAKEPLERYKLNLMPGALTDYFDGVNDTLAYSFSTKNTSDYGNLRVNLNNVRRFPVIIELTNAKGDVLATRYSEEITTIDFNALDPALYTLRLIYDDNNNQLWDTGSYLDKRQTEEVIYFPTEIDVRSNWDVDQTFTLP